MFRRPAQSLDSLEPDLFMWQQRAKVPPPGFLLGTGPALRVGDAWRGPAAALHRGMPVRRLPAARAATVFGPRRASPGRACILWAEAGVGVGLGSRWQCLLSLCSASHNVLTASFGLPCSWRNL